VKEKNNEIANTEVRVSKRQKRNPVNRNKDFFMGEGLMDNQIISNTSLKVFLSNY
jgi:hypothetical protein